MGPDVSPNNSPRGAGRRGKGTEREVTSADFEEVAEAGTALEGLAPQANDDILSLVAPMRSNKASQRVSHLSQITADRPIFTLSVAADLLGLHPRTLRIYEEKKLVVPARTEGNRRRYSQNDIRRFQFIRRLTRGGVNLEGVRVILDMADELTRVGSDPEAIIERNLQTLDDQ